MKKDLLDRPDNCNALPNKLKIDRNTKNFNGNKRKTIKQIRIPNCIEKRSW